MSLVPRKRSSDQAGGESSSGRRRYTNIMPATDMLTPAYGQEPMSPTSTPAGTAWTPYSSFRPDEGNLMSLESFAPDWTIDPQPPLPQFPDHVYNQGHGQGWPSGPGSYGHQTVDLHGSIPHRGSHVYGVDQSSAYPYVPQAQNPHATFDYGAYAPTAPTSSASQALVPLPVNVNGMQSALPFSYLRTRDPARRLSPHLPSDVQSQFQSVDDFSVQSPGLMSAAIQAAARQASACFIDLYTRIGTHPEHTQRMSALISNEIEACVGKLSDQQSALQYKYSRRGQCRIDILIGHLTSINTDRDYLIRSWWLSDPSQATDDDEYKANTEGGRKSVLEPTRGSHCVLFREDRVEHGLWDCMSNIPRALRPVNAHRRLHAA